MDIDAVWTIIIRISVILGIPASAITIGYFIFRRWRRSHNDDRSTDISSLPQSASPKAEAIRIVAKSDPTPDLNAMFDSAVSIPIPVERDKALRTVAEAAVRRGEYEIAIRAGDHSYYRSNKSETLSFVAISAAGQGLFQVADKAASKISLLSDRSEVKNKIIQMHSKMIDN